MAGRSKLVMGNSRTNKNGELKMKFIGLFARDCSAKFRIR